jgi:hypothetical protein
MNISMNHILEELEQSRQILLKFQHNNEIPAIERDLVLSKLRGIYDEVQRVSIEKQEIPAVSEKYTIVEKIATPEIVSFTQTIEKEEIVQEAVPILSAEIHSGINEKAPEHVKVTATSNTTTKTEVISKKEILAEKFQGQNFLNDVLTQFQNTSDLSKKIQNQPLKDIFSAINFNDKFVFIKELFKNDASLYQTTIDKLNTSENFNEAIRYLDENFTWDFNEMLVQKLLELVRRRYLHAE